MLTRISEDKKVNEITKEERKKLVDTLKDFRMTLTGLRGFNEAIITQGGVNVKEIIFRLHGQLGMPREIIDLWRKI